jgi:hypothetical protein
MHYTCTCVHASHYYYYYHHLLSQVFFLPCYFSSWASGEPHHSGFKSQLVALSLWYVMLLVWQFFVGNLLSVALVLFPDIFVNFCLQFRWPQWLQVWQSGVQKRKCIPDFKYAIIIIIIIIIIVVAAAVVIPDDNISILYFLIMFLRKKLLYRHRH